MHRLSSLLFALILLSATAIPASSSELSPAAHLVQLLERLDRLHAAFEQSSGQVTQQTGTIWVKKPDLFRVETAAPLSQTIVSDGVSLWTFDRDLEQVVISALSPRVEDVPVLLLAGHAAEFVDSYDVDRFEDEQSVHFVLEPRDDQALLGGMAVSFSEQLPVRLMIDNAMSERTVIKLMVQTEADIDDETFGFEIPDGIDVIDDRGL